MLTQKRLQRIRDRASTIDHRERWDVHLAMQDRSDLLKHVEHLESELEKAKVEPPYNASSELDTKHLPTQGSPVVVRVNGKMLDTWSIWICEEQCWEQNEYGKRRSWMSQNACVLYFQDKHELNNMFE